MIMCNIWLLSLIHIQWWNGDKVEMFGIFFFFILSIFQMLFSLVINKLYFQLMLTTVFLTHFFLCFIFAGSVTC